MDRKKTGKQHSAKGPCASTLNSSSVTFKSIDYRGMHDPSTRGGTKAANKFQPERETLPYSLYLKLYLYLHLKPYLSKMTFFKMDRNLESTQF